MTDLSSWSSLMGSAIVALVAFYAIQANNEKAALRDHADWYRKTLIEHAGPFLAEMNTAEWQLADSYEHHPMPGLSDREINLRASDALDAVIWKANTAAAMLQLCCSAKTKDEVKNCLRLLHRASGALKRMHQFSVYADEVSTNGPNYKRLETATDDFEKAEREFLELKKKIVGRIEADLEHGPTLAAGKPNTWLEFSARNLKNDLDS